MAGMIAPAAGGQSPLAALLPGLPQMAAASKPIPGVPGTGTIGPATATGVTGNVNPYAQPIDYGIPQNPSLGAGVNAFGFEGATYPGYGGTRPVDASTAGITGDPLLETFGMLLNGVPLGSNK